MPKLSTPHKSGSNTFMVECMLVHCSLVCRDEYYKRFTATSVMTLRKNVINYCKAYGLAISEMSDVYVVHEETTYTKVEGLSLKDNSMKEVLV